MQAAPAQRPVGTTAPKGAGNGLLSRGCSSQMTRGHQQPKAWWDRRPCLGTRCEPRAGYRHVAAPQLGGDVFQELDDLRRWRLTASSAERSLPAPPALVQHLGFRSGEVQKEAQSPLNWLGFALINFHYKFVKNQSETGTAHLAKLTASSPGKRRVGGGNCDLSACRSSVLQTGTAQLLPPRWIVGVWDLQPTGCFTSFNAPVQASW